MISKEIRQAQSPDFYLGYKTGYEAAQLKWISVVERLPEVGQKVMVCGLKNGMQVGAFRGLMNPARKDAWFWKKETLLYVTHWMPLPQAPKEDV